MQPNRIKPLWTEKGVTALSICHVTDALGIGYPMPWEEQCSLFRAWLDRHPSVIYYARPREEYFEREALEIALSAGATYLVLEDLS